MAFKNFAELLEERLDEYFVFNYDEEAVHKLVGVGGDFFSFENVFAQEVKETPGPTHMLFTRVSTITDAPLDKFWAIQGREVRFAINTIPFPSQGAAQPRAVPATWAGIGISFNT